MTRCCWLASPRSEWVGPPAVSCGPAPRRRLIAAVRGRGPARGAAARPGRRQQPGDRRRGLPRHRRPGGHPGHPAGEPAGPDADTVRLTVAAGEDWDGVVASCVAAGLSGLECLSGIPGLTGATPIQNVGAYGQEVAETITTVRVYDRVTGEVADLAGADCGFGYRTSMFKRDSGGPPGRPRRDVPAAAQRAVRAGPVRRAGPLPGRARGRPGPAGDGARGRAHAAPGQGHGARPGRPGQPQRGLVLHQPGAGRRAVRRAAEAGRRRTCRSRGSRPGRARSRCPPRG